MILASKSFYCEVSELLHWSIWSSIADLALAITVYLVGVPYLAYGHMCLRSFMESIPVIM